jgi:hypothetical protein
MIPLDMFQEVAVGMLTETSITLGHNKDKICAELRSLFNIPDNTPLGIHELKRRQLYGTQTTDIKSNRKPSPYTQTNAM